MLYSLGRGRPHQSTLTRWRRRTTSSQSLSTGLLNQNLLTSGLPSQGLLASCRPCLSPRPRWPPRLRIRLFGQDRLLVCWTYHWFRCEQLGSPSPLRPRSSQSPLQSPLRPRSSQSPLQSPLRPRSSQSPLQSPLRPRSSQSPLQSPLRPRSSQSPLQSPLRPRSSQSPLQRPLRSRSSQSSLQRPLNNVAGSSHDPLQSFAVARHAVSKPVLRVRGDEVLLPILTT